MLYTLIIGIALLLVGIFAMLTQKNLIKIILGFSIADTGVHIIIVSFGYLKDTLFKMPVFSTAIFSLLNIFCNFSISF